MRRASRRIAPSADLAGEHRRWRASCPSNRSTASRRGGVSGAARQTVLCPSHLLFAETATGGVFGLLGDASPTELMVRPVGHPADSTTAAEKSAQAPPRPRDRPSAGHRTRPTRWRPDQGYTGEGPAQTALEGSSYRSSSFRRRSRLCLVATRGVVDRIFGWLNGFHRLARHYGRSAETLADLRFVIFSVPMLIQSSSLSKSA
ncbi:hypothetical protein QFZ97_006944 [Paraburkholderia youngii]